MNKKQVERDKISEKYKWKLEDLYANSDEWESDYKKVELLLNDITRYEGLIKDSESLLSVLKLNDEISMVVEKLFVYSRMRRDEDNRSAKYQALTNKAMMLSIQVSSKTSFIVPEILSIEESKLRDYIEKNKQLETYRQFLLNLLRYKPYTLSEKEERILAESQIMSQSSDNIFTMLDNADIKFPEIKDESGNYVEITHGNYIKLQQSNDREVRKNSFNGLYNTYKSFVNTYTATMDANVKKDIFYARIRHHKSSLEASLFDDNVPIEVYDNLIKATHDKIDLLHRYVNIRKEMLKLDELHMYDLYVPLVKDIDREYTYEDSLNIVLKGLSSLGEDYISILNQGFKSRWIDVFENKGKTSGAYSWGAYGTHPYVLLNFQGRLDDVFTIAHEMGHSLHTYYSDKTQPYVYSQYRILVAEVASTCNESILMNYLLNNTSDKNEKLYLINHYLEEFKGTIFRQVMFAEFEKFTHEELEKGGSLTPEVLCKKYHDLNKYYYGDNIIIDDGINYEWERIPHFYTSFYVYKYATGFAAATALSQMILKDGTNAVKKYKEFLKSGSSDYPLNLLKKAGVDLTTERPILNAMSVFEKLLNEMEKLI